MPTSAAVRGLPAASVPVGQVELHVISLRRRLIGGVGCGAILERSRACRPRQPQSCGGQNAECRGANLQTSATTLFDEATYARLRHGHPQDEVVSRSSTA